MRKYAPWFAAMAALSIPAQTTAQSKYAHHSHDRQTGWGAIINTTNHDVHLHVSGQPGTSVGVDLAPNETVKLRRFESYEVAIPKSRNSYTVDASPVEQSGARPILTESQQRFYHVAAGNTGQLVLRRGLPSAWIDALNDDYDKTITIFGLTGRFRPSSGSAWDCLHRRFREDEIRRLLKSRLPFQSELGVNIIECSYDPKNPHEAVFIHFDQAVSPDVEQFVKRCVSACLQINAEHVEVQYGQVVEKCCISLQASRLLPDFVDRRGRITLATISETLQDSMRNVRLSASSVRNESGRVILTSAWLKPSAAPDGFARADVDWRFKVTAEREVEAESKVELLTVNCISEARIKARSAHPSSFKLVTNVNGFKHSFSPSRGSAYFDPHQGRWVDEPPQDHSQSIPPESEIDAIPATFESYLLTRLTGRAPKASATK